MDNSKILVRLIELFFVGLISGAAYFEVLLPEWTSTLQTANNMGFSSVIPLITLLFLLVLIALLIWKSDGFKDLISFFKGL